MFYVYVYVYAYVYISISLCIHIYIHIYMPGTSSSEGRGKEPVGRDWCPAYRSLAFAQFPTRLPTSVSMNSCSQSPWSVLTIVCEGAQALLLRFHVKSQTQAQWFDILLCSKDRVSWAGVDVVLSCKAIAGF